MSLHILLRLYGLSLSDISSMFFHKFKLLLKQKDIK
nr:MAG TPA: hypothetical protein [Caudoviricetes sp.]DAT66391.1 MAG TPA: hypothetical protein [Caudoviricetes sp.]